MHKTGRPGSDEDLAGEYRLEGIRTVQIRSSDGKKSVNCYYMRLLTPYQVSCLAEHKGISKTTWQIQKDLVEGGILADFGIVGFIENIDDFIYYYDSDKGIYTSDNEFHSADAVAGALSIQWYDFTDENHIECDFCVRGDFSLPAHLLEKDKDKEKEIIKRPERIFTLNKAKISEPDSLSISSQIDSSIEENNDWLFS